MSAPDLVLQYIDPGAGSLIFQAVAGGILAAGVTAKLYWRRFTALFRRPRK